MPKYKVFSKKELERDRKDMVELHKRCIKTYLVQRSIKVKTRNKFFKLYDMYVNEKNITSYFFLPTHIFIKALVLDILDSVSNYTYHGKKIRKRKPRKKG